ncbi:MAG TPA: formate--tetrahydrofolate ligase [Candidatus Cryosericum sp.]|nr:formate--tetrahydrofolate ligase [Candidatus Cryosericum sp.]HPS69140.1 formate--tetrahydrofolate ligase [Candidatus Cryosericum sp.]
MFEKGPGKKDIAELAESLGIRDEEIDYFGRYMGKVDYHILDRLQDRPEGKYIDVTAITPTPFGEGKTVTTIGLGMALNKLGFRTVNALREPSMGPVFGIKGGGTGGGKSSLFPMEQINLHFTGDIHAVETATNLLAAAVDNHISQGNELDIDPQSISWRRTMDVEDRSLRRLTIPITEKKNGVKTETAYQTGFDIAAASPVMAILGLTTGFEDLHQRLAEIVVARTRAGTPVTVADLHATGGLAAVLKDAIYPNLVQTEEGTPSFVHIGPFANIAFGNNSVLSDRIALRLGDYVVTESGFGADMGFEKLMDIKLRQAGMKAPDCVVIVATIRALKMHGGAYTIKPGKKLDPALVAAPNMPALELGCENLRVHIENVRSYGLPVVVAINRFPDDTADEVALVQRKAVEFGAVAAVPHTFFVDGSDGGLQLAQTVQEVAASSHVGEIHYPYELTDGIEEKMRKLVRTIYRAKDIDLAPLAAERIKEFTAAGYGGWPICMAKTHLSISHDPDVKGAPSGYLFPIRDIRAATGARFLYPLGGTMETMPGLSKVPALVNIDVTEDGTITGLR